MKNIIKLLIVASLLISCAKPAEKPPPETLSQLKTRLKAEINQAYSTSPYSALSKDYFSRFSRDPNIEPVKGEIEIDETWQVILSANAAPLSKRIAGDFTDFMQQCMGVHLTVVQVSPSALKNRLDKKSICLDAGGGDGDVAGSFTIAIDSSEVRVYGQNPGGLCDGIVKLVDAIGFRQAPFLTVGEQVYKPRLNVRLGKVPQLGSPRDLVFMGYNAALIGESSLYALSASEAIPELNIRRQKGVLENMSEAAKEADQYGLKTYLFINTRKKFPKDDPVFLTHPEIRGALTTSADGEFVLCTEHPLVKRYLCESVQGLFREIPQLDGLLIIIGGEGFYHCFMRTYGVEKGHTNCARCEALGAEQVVSNLCNYLAEAAREVNPEATIVAWPYSTKWSVSNTQSEFISLLKPGTAIITEIEKDESIQKTEGVTKVLWDYSIDLIGPGERAKQQIKICKSAGIPIYLKSEPELSFEDSRLPDMPCLDRWAHRASALASCGEDGAWVFPAFRPCYGTSTAEINKHFWWEPAPETEDVLLKFASRIAGEKGGPHLRNSWKYVSQAIEWSPKLPPYYKGPYYLGPAHPMCADQEKMISDMFYGQHLFRAERSEEEGLKLRKMFITSPDNNIEVFGRFYRRMETLLKKAVDELDMARSLVPERCRLVFNAEDSAIRWFYHTTRSVANFYESCQLRDRLLLIAEQSQRSSEDIVEARQLYDRWQHILKDELDNAVQALPVMEADVRLDFYYDGDLTFNHGVDVIRAKIGLIKNEIMEYLPTVAERCGIKL